MVAHNDAMLKTFCESGIFLYKGKATWYDNIDDALKVYKELDRILKLNGIKLSIDKVLRMAKTVTTIQVRLPLNGQLLSRTMVMKRHKPIEKLFDENFWVSQ